MTPPERTKISRRDFIRLTAGVTAASLLPGCQFSASDKERPNVLFIAVDDLRPELGCYGNTVIKSPNIDRLAASGMTFGGAYCQSGVCNPSRASLLTGRRPDTIQTWDLQTNFRDNVPDVVTLPQYFKQNGYLTQAIGKIYHNDIPDPESWSEPKIYLENFPFDPDAVYRDDVNLANIEKRQGEIVKEGRQDRYIDRFGKWYLKETATEIVDKPDNVYYDGAQTDRAIRQLSVLKNGDKPFFFAVGYYRPHLPFNAPKKYWDLYDPNDIPMAENTFVPEGAPIMAINTLSELRGYTDFRNTPHPADGFVSEQDARHLKHGYYASVSYVDTQIGRLLNELDRLGLRDNTIVVLWGDHGWKLGEHASWAKMTNFEIDTHAPLIVSAPGMENKGSRCDGMVEFVDVYPTLCDLSGLKIPKGLEGISAVPLMHNPARPWKSAVFSQFLREGRWKAPDGREYMGHAIRTDRYRYVEWIDWETRQLAAREVYDHQNDPQENKNLADLPENKALVKELAGRLKAGWRAALPK